jgi:hypothetical protein
MKWLFPLMLAALSACTTVAPAARPEPASIATSAQTLGTLSLTGDELQQTGRTELSDALRALSPIFH